MGHKALTWQQVMLVLCILAMLIFSIMGFGADMDANVRKFGYFGLAISVVMAVVFLLWHFKSVSQPDVYPDFLGALSEEKNLLEVNDGLIAWNIAQLGQQRLWMEIFVQNERDGPGTFLMTVKPDKLLPASQMSFQLPGAAVARAAIIMEIPPIDGMLDLSLALEGSCMTSGKRIRFIRRRAIVRRSDPALTGLLLLTGHLHYQKGTSLRVKLGPPAEPRGTTAVPLVTNGWEAEILWEIGDDGSVFSKSFDRQELRVATPPPLPA